MFHVLYIDFCIYFRMIRCLFFVGHLDFRGIEFYIGVSLFFHEIVPRIMKCGIHFLYFWCPFSGPRSRWSLDAFWSAFRSLSAPFGFPFKSFRLPLGHILASISLSSILFGVLFPPFASKVAGFGVGGGSPWGRQGVKFRALVAGPLSKVLFQFIFRHFWHILLFDFVEFDRGMRDKDRQKHTNTDEDWQRQTKTDNYINRQAK